MDLHELRKPEDIQAMLALMIHGTTTEQAADEALPGSQFSLAKELEKLISAVDREDLEFWIKSVGLHQSMAIRESEDDEAERLGRLLSMLETVEDLLDTSGS